jgi:site-specific recombinase XerD
VHVAAWVESLAREFSPPSVKQALAAVRMLFDLLVAGQMLAVNAVTVVREPKYVVKVGKSPTLVLCPINNFTKTLEFGED